MPKIKTTLISVYNKNGIANFSRRLSELGIDIISTGGTSELLKKEGISHRQVEDITNFPEKLEGRVKTLHPNIFMGILALRNQESHLQTLSELGLEGIDMVVVNLYPFVDTINKEDITIPEAVGQIDIGGVSLLRAAAKNYQDVVAVTSPEEYETILGALFENENSIPEDISLKAAIEVFATTSTYDWYISRYLSDISTNKEYFPDHIYAHFEKVQELRYGENPHQKAALYHRPNEKLPYNQLSGKELSYNNLIDIDSAIMLPHEFEQPAATIIKHTNPCGLGIDNELEQAFDKALATDSVSAFGGIIGVNCKLDLPTSHQEFLKFYS